MKRVLLLIAIAALVVPFGMTVPKSKAGSIKLDQIKTDGSTVIRKSTVQNGMWFVELSE